MRTGVDVGGTNTDALLMDGATVVSSIKAPTTGDVGAGVVAAIEGVLTQSGVSPETITGVMIGTTQFTNAIVERRRLVPVAIVRLALPATKSLNPLIDWPHDLVDTIGRNVYMAEGGYEVDGREISPLDEAEIARIARDIAAKGLESIDVERWFDAYSHTAPGGANKALEILGQIMNAALAAGHVGTAPFKVLLSVES